jgi:hypothetical protein
MWSKYNWGANKKIRCFLQVLDAHESENEEYCILGYDADIMEERDVSNFRVQEQT